MSKFYGTIGFVKTEEVEPGVWEPIVIEKKCYGDCLSSRRRFDANDKSTNDNITINNEFRILADPYTSENLEYVRYLIWKGPTKWKINSVTVEYPAIKFSVSGVYND